MFLFLYFSLSLSLSMYLILSFVLSNILSHSLSVSLILSNSLSISLPSLSLSLIVYLSFCLCFSHSIWFCMSPIFSILFFAILSHYVFADFVYTSMCLHVCLSLFLNIGSFVPWDRRLCSCIYRRSLCA